MKRTLMPVLIGILLALAATQAAVAAPIESAAQPSFTISPTSQSLTAPVGQVGYGQVTVTTGRKAIALYSPSTSSSPLFGDTHYGTCWQDYLSLNQTIPARTTCTVEVGFISYNPGTFAATLSIAECLKWHASPNGLSCEKAAANPKTVALTGTALPGPADLTIIGVLLGNVAPGAPADYRVDVFNIGQGLATPGFQVQGVWSTDNVLDETDTDAGATLNVGGLPGGGVGQPMFITTEKLPSPEHAYLIVEVDHGNLVEESDEGNNYFLVPLPAH